MEDRPEYITIPQQEPDDFAMFLMVLRQGFRLIDCWIEKWLVKKGYIKPKKQTE